MSKTVGIDLGTTNSLVAILENGIPRILERNGERLIPSVVGLSDEGEFIVGQAALNQYVLAPERTIRSIKRKMGSTEKVQLGDKSYLPEEISAFILTYLKKMAEELLGEPVTEAVITVPAYFNDLQRQATKRAGELAGLNVIRIINEPTAAALAYGIDRQEDQYLLVYDLGGGTFDVSVIEQQGEILEVRASNGNVNLGGDDFDEKLLEHLLLHLSTSHRYDFKADRRAMARLSRAAERAKVVLSDAPYAQAVEEFLARYDGNIAHLNVEVNRDEFEELIAEQLDSTCDLIDKALTDAELKAEQLKRVLLVGGSSRIPMVRELLEEHLGLEPSMEVNPDEAVALGAAVQAGIIKGDSIAAMLIDVAPHSLGIEVAELFMTNMVPGRFAPLIHRNTTIPTTKSERFFTITPTQDTVEVKVFQGEKMICAENTSLGSFQFTDIPPSEDPERPREIIVQFSYNLDGILEVSAFDRHGKRKESLVLNTLATQRAASEPEQTAHFEPELERTIKDAIGDATRMETQLEADGKKKAAEKIRTVRHRLEKAHAEGKEPQARKALEKLEDMLYEYE
ncbi:MAG: Hsp70 family protein [Acidobacteria bacterium]|nr:Hsp70 family protein [Acidobacteriota bacterium]